MMPVVLAIKKAPAVSALPRTGGLVGYTFKVWSARKLVMMDGEAAALHLTSQDGDQVTDTTCGGKGYTSP